MNYKHLFWIIPLTIIITLIPSFIWGASVSWELVREKCNQGMEITDSINQLECELSDYCMAMWEYYEIKSPKVFDYIMNNVTDMKDEFVKYGINYTY